MSTLTFIDHNGKLAFMEADERAAIEISGRCSHDRYAHDDPPEVTLPKAGEKVAAMEGRPGAIDYGSRPVHVEDVPRLHSRPGQAIHNGEWHLLDRRQLGGYASCGKPANKSDVFGFTKFGRMRTHRRVCRACYLEWRSEFSSDNGRRMK